MSPLQPPLLTLRLANLPEEPSLKWEGPALSHRPWELAQQMCRRLNGNIRWIVKYYRNAGFPGYRSRLLNLGVPHALGIHVPEELSSVCAEYLWVHRTGTGFICCSFGLFSVGPVSAVWNLEVLLSLLIFWFLSLHGWLGIRTSFVAPGSSLSVFLVSENPASQHSTLCKQYSYIFYQLKTSSFPWSANQKAFLQWCRCNDGYN